MEQVRIGIIGAGRIAHIMSDAYRQLAEARLVAVADIVRDLAVYFGYQRTGCINDQDFA